MIRIKTMAFFLTLLPRAIFRTQPKAYCKAFLQKLQLSAINFFTKKPHHKCLSVFQNSLILQTFHYKVAIE